MQYQSYQKSNNYITLWAEVPAASGTVTVSLLKDDDSFETLSDSTCSGSGNYTDLFYWSTSGIITQPTSMVEYVYWMEDSYSHISDPVKIVIGGYVDDITDVSSTVSGTDEKVDDIITTISGIDSKVDDLTTTISGIDVRVLLIKKCHTNRLELADGNSNNWILYDDDDSTPLLTFTVTDKNGSSIIQQANIPSKRSKAV